MSISPRRLSALACLLLSACSAPSVTSPPATAAKVDLARYAGRWYEIARLPMPFQRAEDAAVAEYAANLDGTLAVHNIATRPDSTKQEIRGTATVLNAPQNTKLAVRFDTWFGPLIPVSEQGNYWILHVDVGYQHALVGTPNRRYLWLLSRTAKISPATDAALLAKARALGYDTTALIRDPQR
ncbi:MAG: lipocalin family protein [Verrucomicrobiaceae bacterium]